MDPLKIAFLIPVFPEIHNTFILNQITGLIDRGHDVHLFPLAVGSYDRAHPEVHSYGLRQRDRHIPIPRQRLKRLTTVLGHLTARRNWNRAVLDALNPLRGRKTWSLVPAYTALSFAAEREYDIVHAQFGHLAPDAERLIAMGGVRGALVASFRGADTTSYLPRHRDEFGRVFQRGSLLLPVSFDLRERLLEAGAPAEKTVVHRSGIDLSRFSFAARGRSPGQATEVLFVGRFTEKKGIADALRAFAGAMRELSPDDAGGTVARLTLIGSGPLEGEMRALAHELGIEQSVRFEGHLDSNGVARAMAASHLLIAPSVTAASGDTEGVPNVIKEAMATGMPVLSTRHGGIPELVEDGASGYLVDERDVEGLTRRLVELIEEPSNWAAFGRAGRAKVEAEFGSEKLNDELVELYRAAVS